jgi:uncharacterized protein (TIGR02594 family)
MRTLNMQITAFDLAQRYVGIAEIAGDKDHPLVVWWLSLCGLTDCKDETAWCSAFVNGIAWELRLPRSKSAAARSWLSIGRAVTLSEAEVGFDVVVLQRGTGKQPGPDVLTAPGHVGFYAGRGAGGKVLVLGGNQGNAVCVEAFDEKQVLGLRRLVA